MQKTIHSKMSKRLREVLKEMRNDAGLTQRDLAKILNCAQSFIGKVETGERRLDVVEFCVICKACGQNPEKMIVKLYQGF